MKEGRAEVNRAGGVVIQPVSEGSGSCGPSVTKSQSAPNGDASKCESPPNLPASCSRVGNVGKDDNLTLSLSLLDLNLEPVEVASEEDLIQPVPLPTPILPPILNPPPQHQP